MTHFFVHLVAPVRRQDIPAKARYSLYKADLRADFSSACGYCGTSDFYSGGQSGFHIDHFAPKSKFEKLKNHYGNLVYSCPICNIGKSNDWPGDDAGVSYVGNIGYVDPCSTAYSQHLRRDSAGKIIPMTPLGEYIYKRMKLYLKRRQVCWLVDKMESQLQILGRIIAESPDNLDQFKNFYKLTMQYMHYTGFLKRD